MRPYEVHFNTKDVTVYLAAAGAGKTEAVISKATDLFKVYRPDEVGLTTFTRKGVRNAVDRAIAMNPQFSFEDLVYWQTIHHLCFHEAGLKHVNIIERSDLNKFNELTGFHLNQASTFDNQTDDDKMLQRYDAIRSGGDKGVFVHSTYNEEHYGRLVSAYEGFKKMNNLVDFYDCLVRFRDRNMPLNVKAFIIDEAQDLTHLHWEVIEIMTRNCEVVLIAGDDFQSLFSYSGASPETLIFLASKYPTVKLETSYRLPHAVYRFTKGITQLIQNKVDKDYAPALSSIEGFVKDMPDRTMLARIVRKDIDDFGFKSGRWYFLFRANHFIASVTDILENFTIPFHTSKSFVISAEDLSKITRFYNYRKEGYGSLEAKANFMKEYQIADINEDFTESNLIPSSRRFMYLDYVKRWGIEELNRFARSEPYLLLATTYKVKGGECDFCAVFMDATKLVSQNTMLHLDGELRVLYVACSRPRVGLYLVNSEGRYGQDNVIALVKEIVEVPSVQKRIHVRETAAKA